MGHILKIIFFWGRYGRYDQEISKTTIKKRNDISHGSQTATEGMTSVMGLQPHNSAIEDEVHEEKFHYLESRQ